VNRKTRSERIKENRANRMKRAADIVEGKVSTVNTKNLKRNKMIILIKLNYLTLIFMCRMFLPDCSSAYFMYCGV